MSEKMNSIDQRDRDQVDDARVTKLNKPGKHPLKHTNCQSIPSTLMAYGHNQASAHAGPSDGKHHHHHHHHNHGHHQPHVIHRTTSESLRLASEINCTEGSSSLSNSTSMSGSSGTSSSSANQPLLSASMARKPKTSSFQITSVTVGNKLSADNGDDSADDLDESHTDDNSRITDMENETPSFSEDTFSKEDVFFSNSALGTAPVIPTSSQYGLVIVDPDLSGVGGQAGPNLSNVHVSMTDAGINIVGPPSGKGDSDQKEGLHHRNERFKVVKIESTEPFKRGRWMCMDYLDHSTLQGTDNATTSSNTGSTGNSTGVTTNDSGVVMLENNSELGCESGEPNTLYNASMASMMTNVSHSPGQTLQKPLMEPHSQPMTNNISAVPSGMLPQVSASMPNAVVTSAPQANIVNYSQQQMHQTLPNQQYQQHQQHQQATHMQGQSQPAHFYQSNQPNQQIANMHGATLPSNIQIQNGVPSNFIAQVPQQPQAPAQSMPAVNLGMVAGVPDMNAANIVTSIPNSSMAQPVVMSQPATMVQAMPQNMQQNMVQSMPQSMPQVMPQSLQQTIPQSMPQTIPQSMPQTMPQSMPQTIPQSMPQTIPQSMPQNMQQTIPQSMPQNIPQSMPQSIPQSMPQSIPQSMPQSIPQSMPQTIQQSMPQSIPQALPQSMQQAQMQMAPPPTSQAYPGTIPVTSTSGMSMEMHHPDVNMLQQAGVVGVMGMAPNVVPQTISPGVDTMVQQVPPNQVPLQSIPSMTQQQEGAPQMTIMSDGSSTVSTPQQTQATAATIPPQQSNDEEQATAIEADSESASGTSAVAIDNKIEQAMDLVKSHLMIAVREEVEVLKEKIAELMDRINQLELENTILKANVSQETLSQLSATMQTASAKPPQNPNTNNGPVS